MFQSFIGFSQHVGGKKFSSFSELHSLSDFAHFPSIQSAHPGHLEEQLTGHITAEYPHMTLSPWPEPQEQTPFVLCPSPTAKQAASQMRWDLCCGQLRLSRFYTRTPGQQIILQKLSCSLCMQSTMSFTLLSHCKKSRFSFPNYDLSKLPEKFLLQHLPWSRAELVKNLQIRHF